MAEIIDSPHGENTPRAAAAMVSTAATTIRTLIGRPPCPIR